MRFCAYEVKIDNPLERTRFVEEFWKSSAPALVLDTCQRLECYGFEVASEGNLRGETWLDHDAFERLARIAAGLESRILGELEVMGQVRNAYKCFHGSKDQKLNQLDRVFQDAIALARKARKQSGVDNNLTSLSGLAARQLIDQTPAGEPLAVVGSGTIAASVVRYLTKRGKSPVRISSRCPGRAASLAFLLGAFSSSLDDLAPMLKDVRGIITATAAPHPVLYPHHLEGAARPLHIIDLGEPADSSPEVPGMPDLHYAGLEVFESRANLNTDERRRCAESAARIIRDGAIAWSRNN